jgi:transcriptional regulator
MYRPPPFMVDDYAVGFELIRNFPLAQLVLVGDDGSLIATPVPLLADVDNGRLLGHLARPNPVATIERVQANALVIFSGDDAYISPNYYPSKHENPSVVPTWNYETVQISGELTVHDDAAWTEWVVRRLTNEFEHDQTAPWKVDDAPSDYLARMVRSIVGIEISINAMTMKRKLSQNRSAMDRRGVRENLRNRSTREQAAGNAMQPDDSAE